MKKLLTWLLSYIFLGCTFESPFPSPDAGKQECNRSCREAGAKGAEYESGPLGALGRKRAEVLARAGRLL